MFFKKTLLAAAAISALAVVATAQAASNPATGSFNVTLTINKNCSVTVAQGTNDIAFGNNDANPAANLQGIQSAAMKVNCSKGTAFAINLTPASTTSTTGAGNMSGAISGNTDKVAYQLRQTTGQSAAVWGNTGTVSGGVATAGNAVTGTGTGMANALSFPVYATVASTDFTPDAYKDTVNVSVVY